jgi:hypothetical protein
MAIPLRSIAAGVGWGLFLQTRYAKQRKTMKYIMTIALFITLASISCQSIAGEITYGLGVEVNDDLKIYLPINMGGLILEPTFSMFDRENHYSNSSNQYDDDSKIIAIGLGVFKNNEVSQNTYMYYGGRFGYIDREDSYTSTSTTFSFSSSTEEDGYFIAPTIGAQYYFTHNISIGLDLSYVYSKTEGTTTSGTAISDSESTNYRTEAEIILRYMF